MHWQKESSCVPCHPMNIRRTIAIHKSSDYASHDLQQVSYKCMRYIGSCGQFWKMTLFSYAYFNTKCPCSSVVWKSTWFPWQPLFLLPQWCMMEQTSCIISCKIYSLISGTTEALRSRRCHGHYCWITAMFSISLLNLFVDTRPDCHCAQLPPKRTDCD